VNDEKYIGPDVHQATVVVAVMDSTGKLVMESNAPPWWPRTSQTTRHRIVAVARLSNASLPRSWPRELLFQLFHVVDVCH
jgi:hypothetical protein